MDVSQRRPRRRRSRRLIIDVSNETVWKCIGLILLVWLVFSLRTTLTLVLMSLILVATLYPFMKRVEARFGRKAAVAALTSGYLVGCLFVGYVLVPMITSETVALVQNAPLYAQQLQTTLTAHHIHWDVSRQLDAASSQLRNASNIMAFAEDFLGGVYGI